MKIKVIKNIWWDHSEGLEIFSDDGKIFLTFHDGEPEDNNLLRNFSDCYEIPEALKKAWEAGKRGEEFEIEVEVIKEDE